MKNNRRMSLSLTVISFLCVFSIATVAFCRAGPKPAGAESAPEEGFVDLLFVKGEGYTKSNWNHSGNGCFSLERETGVLTSHSGGGLLWYAARQFKDFVLELEYMTEEETANSGIFLRMPNVPVAGNYIPESFEIQIFDSMRGGELHTTGAIYDCEPPVKKASLGPGKWNHFKITFEGLHLVVELNGEVINDWMAEPRGKVLSHWPEGYIGVQNHDGRSSIKFRNIRIKEL